MKHKLLKPNSRNEKHLRKALLCGAKEGSLVAQDLLWKLYRCKIIRLTNGGAFEVSEATQTMTKDSA